MGITIQNVTDSTAKIIWPLIHGCSDSFYSLMYQANQNSLQSGYTRNDFEKEERVPGSRTSFIIDNLTPLTSYVLCVSCQSTNPSSDQCQIFQTSTLDPMSANSRKKEVAWGFWLTISILLLIIAGILVYGFLHIWWRKRQRNSENQNVSSEQGKVQMWMKNKVETPYSTDNLNQLVLNTEENKDGFRRKDIIVKTQLTNSASATLNPNNPETVPKTQPATLEL